MTLSPEKAWQSALGQLQMEMPKASFDAWVRDTRLLSCEDGSFTIGVRNDYAREWLESRLTSTVSRLLMGILNREIELTFVVDEPIQASAGQTDSQSDADAETAAVQVVHRLRYDEVVLPERIVALPGYFSRLIPEIGARNAWLYVGWRQAVWDGQRQDKSSRTRRVPVREIVRFSGLSRRTFFRAVEDPSTWQALSGLVEQAREEPRWTQGRDRRTHRLPNTYTVQMTLPLSQADAACVREWLKVRLQDGMPLLDALLKAAQIQDLVGELLPPVGSSSTDPSPDQPRTVMEIVGQLTNMDGKLPADLQEASEALHQKIISAFGTILLTHYFLETVIPNAKLTPPQAWLVTLLRDRCYMNRATGEIREEALVRGGYAELASWLGLTRAKTIWEWVRDDQDPVSAFLSILPSHEHDEVDSLRLRVRLEEPIFAGAPDTIELAQVAPLGGANGTITNGADDTHRLARMAPLAGAVGTLAWREWHSLKHLKTSPNTQERITPIPQDAPAAAPAAWVLRKLLVQAHVHPKVRKELLEKNASVQAFVSWLLFACSPTGEGIKDPLAYALASLREDPSRGPGGAFDQLAALHPEELIGLARWSVQHAARKFDLRVESSGNETWDETMGVSQRLAVLLAILLGGADPTRS